MNSDLLLDTSSIISLASSPSGPLMLQDLLRTGRRIIIVDTIVNELALKG